MQPGAYSNYPRPVRNELSLNVIGEAFRALTANIGPFVVWSIVTLALTLGVFWIFILAFVGMPGSLTNPEEIQKFLQVQVQGNLVSIFASVVSGLLSGPLYASVTHMTLKHMGGQRLDIADVLWGFGRFVPFAIAGVVCSGLVTVGYNLCCLPGAIVGGLTFLVYPAMILQGLSAFDALSFSFSRMSKHLFMATLLHLLLYVLSLLGIVACCVGLLFTLPLVVIPAAFVYRDIVGFPQAGLEPAPMVAPVAEAPPADPGPAAPRDIFGTGPGTEPGPGEDDRPNG